LKVLVIAAIQSLSDEKIFVAHESVFQTFQTLYGVFNFLHNPVSANHTHIRNVGSIEASIPSSTHNDQFLNQLAAYLFKKFLCLSISEFQVILKVLDFLFDFNSHLNSFQVLAL
jgi:hypothetical protein